MWDKAKPNKANFQRRGSNRAKKPLDSISPAQYAPGIAISRPGSLKTAYAVLCRPPDLPIPPPHKACLPPKIEKRKHQVTSSYPMFSGGEKNS